MIYSIVLAALSIGQGEAVMISVPDEPGLAAVTVEWNGVPRPLVAIRPSVVSGTVLANDDRWQALLGADLDDMPGVRRLTVRRVYGDGRVTESPLELVVEPRDYPETRLTVEQRYVELNRADQSRAAEEAAEIASIYATARPEQLWAGAFAIPIAGVAGGTNFGHRRYFNDRPRAPHSGADLRAAEGTPVLASNDGQVVLAKPLFFSGNAVFVDHGLGVYSVYLHLSEFHVSVGDRVRKGDPVGLAGATGRVTGPHLHWGIRIYGARVDPFSLVSATAQ